VLKSRSTKLVGSSWTANDKFIVDEGNVGSWGSTGQVSLQYAPT
jgi:hypothetical protein